MKNIAQSATKVAEEFTRLDPMAKEFFVGCLIGYQLGSQAKKQEHTDGKEEKSA